MPSNIRMAAVLTCVAAAAPVFGMVNGTAPGSTDERFDAVAAFGLTDKLSDSTAFGDDPMNLEEHNHFGNGVLIASNKVLMAKHLIGSTPPASGRMTFRFRRKTDGSVGSVSSGWQSFHQVAVTSYEYSTDTSHDVVIATLADHVTHIDPVEYSSPYDLGMRMGDPIFLAGWGQSGGVPSYELRYVETAVTGLACTAGISSVHYPDYYDVSNPCSCGPALHDSGGGLFVENSKGEMVLVATMYATHAADSVMQHEALNPYSLPICCEAPPIRCADLTGDGQVTLADQNQMLGSYGTCTTCYCAADLDRNGVINGWDLYHLQQQLTAQTQCTGSCLGDATDDGLVDSSDMAQLLGQWGACPCTYCSADFDCDGLINSSDMAILLGTWGGCP